jgi:hypothetical protein
MSSAVESGKRPFGARVRRGHGARACPTARHGFPFTRRHAVPGRVGGGETRIAGIFSRGRVADDRTSPAESRETTTEHAGITPFPQLTTIKLTTIKLATIN